MSAKPKPAKQHYAARAAEAALAIAAVAVLASAADASHTIARDVAKPRLLVLSTSAQATARSTRTWVSLAGALNSRPAPSRTKPNYRFKVRYGVRPRGRCAYAREVRLPLLVQPVCRARDGTLWAAQSWERLWPNHGGNSAPAEVRVAHFTLPVARFEDVHWEKRFGAPLLRGRLTWRGRGVYGFCGTSTGVPCDTYGRLVYLDTYDSALGPGWHRENSFLTQGPGQVGYSCGSPGCFAYSFSGRAHRALGTRFRLTADGPGVTPVVRTIVGPPTQ